MVDISRPHLRIVPTIGIDNWKKETVVIDADYTTRAQELVRAEIVKTFQPLWAEEGEEPTEGPPFNTRIVWAAKVLQNWKAIVISTLPDQKMYEVTHDGEKNRTYVDTYEKIKQTVIRDVT